MLLFVDTNKIRIPDTEGKIACKRIAMIVEKLFFRLAQEIPNIIYFFRLSLNQCLYNAEPSLLKLSSSKQIKTMTSNYLGILETLIALSNIDICIKHVFALLLTVM